MGDPLTDPRAQELLSAQTGEISSLAGSFHRVASQAQTSAAALRGAHGDATWTGTAADAFRAQVGKLPGDLDKVQQSYGEVATALDSYGSQLGPIQTQFRSLATQLQDAQSSLSTAQGTLSNAKTSLSTATSAPHAKPTTPAVVNAHTAMASATGAVSHLQGEVSGLQSQGFRLLDEFDTIRGRAHSTVSSAAGIAPSESWLSGALSAVGNFFAGVGKGIVDDIANIPDAVANVWDHPGDPAAWGELVKDVAVAASIVAMAAAPFAAPELLEADAAADAAGTVAADTAGDVAGDVTGDAAGDAAGDTAGDGAGGAADSTDGPSAWRVGAREANTWGNRVATGAGIGQVGTDGLEGNWKGALLASAFIVAPNLGGMPSSFDAIKGPGDLVSNWLGVGDKLADSTAETANAWNAASKDLADYQQFREWGVSAATSQHMAFENGVPEVLKNFNLDDSSVLTAGRDSAIQLANQSSATAMHVGRPLAGAVDKVIVEPIEDKISDKLAPSPAG
jgi:hypothetical protein